MSKDGITHEMIVAHQAKLRLIPALQNLLDGRIATMRTQPGYTEEMGAKAEQMRDSYIAKANAQPDAFFARLDLPALMTALAKV